MLKHCRDKWYENKDKLESVLRETEDLNVCEYITLVKMVVEHILNPNSDDWDVYDAERITLINDGDYQGTQLFMIPQKTYQPSEYEYILTYVGYGSCSGCDTLLAIQAFEHEKLTDSQVKDFMTLCKDLVCNITKPYNHGWEIDEKYTDVAEEGETNEQN